MSFIIPFILVAVNSAGSTICHDASVAQADDPIDRASANLFLS